MTMAARVNVLIEKHRGSIMTYSGIGLFILFVYHVLSDGDFSFLMTLGSLLRAAGFMLLLLKVVGTKSAAGVSLKTLEMYALVFVFRLVSVMFYDGYLPYDKSGDWLYQLLEIVSLMLTCGLIYLLMTTYSHTYQAKADKFGGPHIPMQYGIVYLVVPALVLAMILHPKLNQNWFTDVSWTFALYLEAVAVGPQLYMFHRKGGEVESFTSHFLVCLGLARLMHLVFWLSTHHELGNQQLGGNLVGYMVVFSQLVHLLLMVDFFYYYVNSVRTGGPVILPT